MKIAITITINDKTLEKINTVMETENMKRSQAVDYLIKMGYLYRYEVIPEQEKIQKNKTV